MADSTEIPETVYAMLHGPCDQASMDSLMMLAANCSIAGVKRLYLFLGTGGGQIQPVISLYNFLRGLEVEVVMHNLGDVGSAGNLLYLAGDVRYATPLSVFTLHPASWGADAIPARNEERDLSDKLNVVQGQQDRISQLLTERTKLPAKRIAESFTRVMRIPAEEAVELGIVHEIRPVELPARTRIEFILPKPPPVGPQPS